MNIINRVRINGFWGNKRLLTPFNSDVNFLIGVNGTGKTTAINMVAAALNADFTTLDRLPFDKISIDLKEFRGKGRTLIEVLKQPRENSPFPEICYRITDRTKKEMVEYSLDSLEEQRSFRDYAFRQHRYRTKARPDILEHMKRLVNVSWLSIHRAESFKVPREDRSYESTVDKKLDDLSGEFVKYLSQLQLRGSQETAKFQQKAFLSLIKQQTMDSLASAIVGMNLNEERDALVSIFRLYRLDEEAFSKSINTHFSNVEISRVAWQKKEPINFDHVISLISMLRVHLVVQEWSNLVKAQEKIFEPRETFLNTINDMLIGKRIRINNRNEFIAVSNQNRAFTLKQLSSGEKQLFIILGESLLQERAPWIYIADEPELSLHVTWQSQLIDSLRKVNPNAQIIFATHSPDIVAQYESKTISMENIIK